jgi:excisionase family DNA binding protein
MSDKELLSAAEAAERLKIAKRTLLRWARENRIRSVKLSRKVVIFAAEAIDEFVKGRAQKVQPASANHQGAGRKTASSKPTKKGGVEKSSRKSWRSLREEVTTWQ